MAPKPKRTSPTWSDVKRKMAEFDRAGLLGTIQDLYAASKDTRAFLHARFGLGPDVLDLYKATIARSLWPDLTRNQLPSVAAAKKATLLLGSRVVASAALSAHPNPERAQSNRSRQHPTTLHAPAEQHAR